MTKTLLSFRGREKGIRFGKKIGIGVVGLVYTFPKPGMDLGRPYPGEP